MDYWIININGSQRRFLLYYLQIDQSVVKKKKSLHCNNFNQTDVDVFKYCFIFPRYLFANTYIFIGEDLQEGRGPMLNLSGLRRMLKQQLQQMKTFITRSSIHAVKIIIKIYRYIDNC